MASWNRANRNRAVVLGAWLESLSDRDELDSASHGTTWVDHDFVFDPRMFGLFQGIVMAKKLDDKKQQGRDARTGRYVPLKETVKHPDRTVVEPRKSPKRK